MSQIFSKLPFLDKIGIFCHASLGALSGSELSILNMLFRTHHLRSHKQLHPLSKIQPSKEAEQRNDHLTDPCRLKTTHDPCSFAIECCNTTSFATLQPIEEKRGRPQSPHFVLHQHAAIRRLLFCVTSHYKIVTLHAQRQGFK